MCGFVEYHKYSNTQLWEPRWLQIQRSALFTRDGAKKNSSGGPVPPINPTATPSPTGNDSTVESVELDMDPEDAKAFMEQLRTLPARVAAAPPKKKRK